MSLAHRRKDLSLKAFTRAHEMLARVTGGRFGRTTAGLPIVKFTTTGRKSGKPRSVMLATPIPDDERCIVVASKGGDDRHPDWYRNLLADPHVVVEPVGGDGPVQMVARTATSAEKAALWSRIATGADGYAAYQRKTDRDIPVVICEPRVQRDAPATGTERGA